MTKDVKLIKTDISVWLSATRSWYNGSDLVKKHIAMTTMYTNNYVFPQEYICSKLAK